MAKGRKTGGRKPGSPNKTTREVRDMVRQALEDAGGVDHLKDCATDGDPRVRSAFLSLVGRLVPAEVSGKLETTGSMVFQIVTGIPGPPASKS